MGMRLLGLAPHAATLYPSLTRHYRLRQATGTLLRTLGPCEGQGRRCSQR